jgi:archaemetzincin
MEPREGSRRPVGDIALWWIGDGGADDYLIGRVREHVVQEYACDVSVVVPADRPVGTRDPKRGQHSSREVLRWLLARVTGTAGRVLGLTDVDLFIPILTFVYGEAQLEGAAAVVSVARLVAAGDPGLTASRLAREAVHELGHTFGLLHCDGYDGTGRRGLPCVMARSASLRAVDMKSARLCADCRARYQMFQQDGSHVYRQHENPHRR